MDRPTFCEPYFVVYQYQLSIVRNDIYLCWHCCCLCWISKSAVIRIDQFSLWDWRLNQCVEAVVFPEPLRSVALAKPMRKSQNVMHWVSHWFLKEPQRITFFPLLFLRETGPCGLPLATLKLLTNPFGISLGNRPRRPWKFYVYGHGRWRLEDSPSRQLANRW